MPEEKNTIEEKSENLNKDKPEDNKAKDCLLYTSDAADD